MCLCIYFLFFYGIIRKNLRLSKFHTCFANSSQPLGFHLARQLGSPEEHLSSVKFSVVLMQFLFGSDSGDDTVKYEFMWLF